MISDLQPSWTGPPAVGGSRPTRLALYVHAPLHALGRAADAARRMRYADTVDIATYIIERNINYTNVCVTRASSARSKRPSQEREGLGPGDRRHPAPVRGDVELGGTQIMFQAGTTPTSASSTTSARFAAIKAEFPQLVIHSLGASEVAHMAKVSPVGHRGGHHPDPRGRLDSFAGPARSCSRSARARRSRR